MFCFFGNLSWWAEAVEIVVFTIFAFLKGECVAVDRMTGTPGVGVCFCANGEYVLRISSRWATRAGCYCETKDAGIGSKKTTVKQAFIC